MKRIYRLLLTLVMVLTLTGCAAPLPEETYDLGTTTAGTGTVMATDAIEESSTETVIDEEGWYYSKDEVALYLCTYDHLPDNYITKKEARELGWEGGSVEAFASGKAIGGDTFGNREGLLPKEKGRVYKECDIDTDGGKPRGAKRIIFSNDGLIYYTEDHYESFTLLYGEE